MAELRWHYGPTVGDPESGKRWHYDCGGEVWYLEGGYICCECRQQDDPAHDLEGSYDSY